MEKLLDKLIFVFSIFYNALLFMIIWFYFILFAEFLIGNFDETQINSFETVAFIMRLGSVVLAWNISDRLRLKTS